MIQLPFLLQARRVRSVILTATALGVGGLLASNSALAVISLRSTSPLELPVVTLLPVVAVIAVCLSTRDDAVEVERSSARSIWMTRGLPVLVSVGLLGAGLGVAAVDPHNQAGLVLRNFAGLAGLGLLATPVTGSTVASFLPVTDVIVNTLLGEGPTGHIAPWAWTLRPVTDPTGWCIAVIAAAAGFTAFVLAGPRQRAEERLHN